MALILFTAVAAAGHKGRVGGSLSMSITQWYENLMGLDMFDSRSLKNFISDKM